MQVESLRDRVIFLGENCAFSAFIGEFIKEISLLFTDNLFSERGKENGGNSGTNIFVFDLDTYGIVFLMDYPEYSRLL